jgi:DNA primase
MDVVALAQWGYPNALATLGTACTAEHVAKLFRFTDAVVFSFDGDAAGRRAAGRALEAALPHATDTRNVRFLFLPAEHDPDSYIRELGPAAFEAAVTQAVPLSAQLVAHAGADCDLATAEGRARMLSQARPLLALLPDGLLREQLVTDLAQRGGLSVEALRAHWARSEPGQAAGGVAAAAAPAGRPRRLRPGRATPSAANQLDRAAWLLTRHADLWLGLSHDTQLLLCEQPAPHGPYFCAIERVLHEHGPLVMGALLQDLSADVDAESLRTLQERVLRFHDIDADPPASMLEAVLRNLELDAVNDELRELTDAGDLSAAAAARLRALYARQAELKRAAVPVP